jgi:hypothetical protein
MSFRADINDSLEVFEVSDLTINCNLAGMPAEPINESFRQSTPMAIYEAGENIRIQRVRVINFGVNSALIRHGTNQGATSFKCFPIALRGRGKTTPSCGWDGAAAYIGYRFLRLTPSLLPPLWPTIPVNAAVHNPMRQQKLGNALAFLSLDCLSQFRERSFGSAPLWIIGG